ncbi:hypothetical protein BU26DRAFT_189275 [Trematosphaeria pertusa]|uniref:Uncharacterized protein n=1 Tax=Trematosphaeria pertusa TaxID=390896 RepID=A0A6A6HRI4_9PLEO|nr:uncharacterized protein BU26DRAFT_189275 [Trematosphaeria pertusa]KAF2240765.1 hypothetical protein BU26DRAFT_189275 [Trematosphaeria pertusa]
MSSNHSRNPSEETNATTNSYNMILEHVLQYPGSYELPLRTMYTLNCAPRAQPLPRDLSRAPSPTGTGHSSNPSPIAGQLTWNDAESASINFTSQLMHHINSLPQQPSSLPPTFIVSFVSRIFHPSLSLVDFPQALTALDYLRDLETRRRKEMVAAFARVHIHPESFEADIDAISGKYPGIALWAKNLEGKNKKAELYYAKMWLGVRRWIMINELSLHPFNKINCMGMLNTLLPPQQNGGKLPSSLLNHQTLKQERESFFHYIQQVQKHGAGVLRPLMEGEKTNWPVVQKEVDKYLRVAKNIIDDCMATLGTEDFKPVEESRKGKKTDSGVSFGSELRPSTGSSLEKPLPDSPADASVPKGLSTLEKITREFKRMRVKTRPDVEEIVKMEQHLPMTGENKGKKIKKARSIASLGRLKQANSSSTSLAGSRKGSDAVPFDAEEMRRARMVYEASQAPNAM